MANVRLIKKDVNRITAELFTEILFRSVYIASTDTTKMQELTDRIFTMHDTFVARARMKKDTKDKKKVKAYYKEFWQDLEKEVISIGDEMDKDDVKQKVTE